jgi:predicted AAA+ superfamily ATPase
MAELDFVITEFLEREIPELTPRALSLPQVPRKASVIVGMRRSGKTFFMFQQVTRLLESGTDKRSILYANFEDDRLPINQPQLLSDLLEMFYRRNPLARQQTAFLFLDEIQNVPDWSRFVRRVLDTESVEVVISGSSAKLLSSEVATELRGRGLAVELFPFSFGESVRSVGIDLPDQMPPGPRLRSMLAAQLDRYLTSGGFPEVQGMEHRERIQTLQDYVELVLLRDVIERHEIENATAARAFARILLQSPARTFSVNKVHADLRSRGMSVSRETLFALLDHFQDAYLVFAITVFKKSERAQATNPRKLYPIDPGLAAAMSHVTERDLGARLENAVFLELRRRHGRLLQGQVSYYLTASGREVDFVVGDVFEQRVGQLVQASVSLADENTRTREVDALTEAMAETGIDQSVIVTLTEDEIIERESGTIRVVPAWHWMLEETTMSGPTSRASRDQQ